jgi:hypothetical protein
VQYKTNGKAKRHLFFPIFIFILIISRHAIAYVPTAEEIAAGLVTHYRGLTALQADLVTVFHGPGGTGEVSVFQKIYIKEGLTLRSDRYLPDCIDVFLQKERIDGTDRTGLRAGRIAEAVLAMVIFQPTLLLLLDRLAFLGIDISKRGIDRLDGELCFTLGRSDEKAPGSRLWISRDRGVPRQFIGIVPNEGQPASVRLAYGDYHLWNKQFWLPGKIECYYNEDLWIASTVTRLELNGAFPDDLRLIQKDRGGNFFLSGPFLNLKD